VVAEFGPDGVSANFDGLDLVGPLLGEEDVVDVVGAIFVVPEMVSGLSLLALGLGATSLDVDCKLLGLQL
jgi:hypothetical protein